MVCDLCPSLHQSVRVFKARSHIECIATPFWAAVPFSFVPSSNKLQLHLFHPFIYHPKQLWTAQTPGLIHPSACGSIKQPWTPWWIHKEFQVDAWTRQQVLESWSLGVWVWSNTPHHACMAQTEDQLTECFVIGSKVTTTDLSKQWRAAEGETKESWHGKGNYTVTL